MMKNIKIILGLFLILLVSCKKDNVETANDNLSVSIDGSNKTFNNAVVGELKPEGGGYVLRIIRHEGSPTTSDQLGILVTSANPITTGTMNGPSTISFATQTGGLAEYTNSTYSANPVTINITSISSTTVTGTFSGDLFLDNNPSLAKKVLTNGQFRVTF